MVLGMKAKDVNWLECRLMDIWGVDCTAQIAEYVASMSSFSEQHEYLSSLLDENNSFHNDFLKEFKNRFNYEAAIEASGIKVYRKVSGIEENYSGPIKPKIQDQNNAKKNKLNHIADPHYKKIANTQVHGEFDIIPKSQSCFDKKGKFVPLYSEEAQRKDVVFLKGRHICDCQATKHGLINNCVTCGKIVCKQERSGPCLFCGSLVCTKEEKEILNRGSKNSEELRQRLMGENMYKRPTEGTEEKGFVKAEAQKDKLLEFDRNSERRTRVIDDEADYFSVDAVKWMTQEQKKRLAEREEEFRQKRYGSKLQVNIDFDFAGRRVVETEAELSRLSLDEDIIKSIYSTGNSVENERQISCNDDNRDNVIYQINCEPKLSDTKAKNESEKLPKTHSKRSEQERNRIAKNSKLRIQDAQLQEMSDQGACLSVHQPYASFLVSGIKKHEGRNWYTPHRGRLWIHASAKEPSNEEMQHLKDYYRILHSKEVHFPSQLPTGCLVGYVDIKEVIPQEQYEEFYQPRESKSPFVFICENPQELLIKFPMPGKPNIYRLDPNIHKAAKSAPKKTNLE